MKKALGFFATFVGSALGAMIGNPLLGIMINSAISASLSGGNFGSNFGIGIASGLVGFGVGRGISKLSFLGKTSGFFASTIGGAAAGAVGAAITGGNISIAAFSGAAGGAAGFLGGLKSSGLGNILGGMVSAAVRGDEIWEGAMHGVMSNLGLTVGGMMIPSKTGPELDGTLQDGDILFEKGSMKKMFKSNFGSIEGFLASMFGDPGPFTHTAIAIGSDSIADSYPDGGDGGPMIRKFKDHPAYNAKWSVVRTGNKNLSQAVFNLTTRLYDVGTRFYGESSNGVYCSQYARMAYGEASISGVSGVGPNTQYFQFKMKGN